MRTQKSTCSLRSATSNPIRSLYVCSSCRSNASRPGSQRCTTLDFRHVNTIQRSKHLSIAPPSYLQTRQLHSTAPTPIEPPSSHLNPGTDANASLKAKLQYRRTGRWIVEGRLREAYKEDARSSDFTSRENIRSRLKRWSEEQTRLATASGKPTQNILRLPPPNSLSIEDLDPEDEFKPWENNDEHAGEDEEEQNTYASNRLALKPGDVFRASMLVRSSLYKY